MAEGISQALGAIASPATSESVDDIPLLLAMLQRLGVQRLIDAHFPAQQPAGGLSNGWVAALWLTHMLSQSGRQVRHMRAWAAAHPETLRWLSGQPVRAADISEARLREVLRALDDDAAWGAFEASLNQHILQSYRLRPERVRMARSDGLWYVSAEGLLQFDYSRRWWPGAMQLQLVLATLDPLGLPATVWIAAPDSQATAASAAIGAARGALPGRRFVYIGNGELSPLEVRASIRAGEDTYLCLLSPDEAMRNLEQALAGAWLSLRPAAAIGEGGRESVAEGYERSEPVRADLGGDTVSWVERRLLVRSRRHAAEQENDLLIRLARAQRALAALNERRRGKRRPRTMAAMREATEQILAEHGVSGLVTVTFDETVDERTVRRYRGRPTTTRVERMISVASAVDDAALAVARERLGWQVYATTLPAEQLPYEQVVRLCGEPDNGFERLRGRPLSLLPGVIQRSDHVRGLVRLLTLGLRCLTLVDLMALARIIDFSAGPPVRSQSQPGGGTAEQLLEAFRDITLTIISDGGRRRTHLTALSALQRRVLDLLALPADTYQSPTIE